MEPTEIWKPVVGHEGAYEVSDFGRVRSLPRRVRLVTPQAGEITRAVTGCILRPGLDSAGYLSVRLGRKTGNVRVHWLVLAAFVGPAPEGAQRLHNDGDRTNNRLSNLRYGTRSENMQDMFRHGQRALNADQVELIRERKAAGFKPNDKKKLAAEFGVSISTINDVAAGRTYAYV